MIAVENITLSIEGKKLLDDVSLSCPTGTLTVLVGPNGAGKSTLLSVIAGDVTPDRGKALLNGKDIEKLKVREMAQLRSVFPQGSMIRFGYTVEEVVAMGRAFRDLPPDEDDDAIRSAMDGAEVTHMAFRNAQTLSGGEQARTTFARVTVQSTPIVLLDEPTAALDLRHQERVLTMAKDMAKSGATVLTVLHDLNLAAAYADTIVLMADARIVASGAPWDVLKQDLVESVYRQKICILEHPVRKCPVVLTSQEEIP